MSELLRFLSDLHVETQRIGELIERKVDGVSVISIQKGLVHVYYGIEIMSKIAGVDYFIEDLENQGKYTHKVYFDYFGTIFFQLLTEDEYDMFTHGLAGQIKVAPSLVV